MGSRVEKALENHKQGYNCSQAVACAFADLACMAAGLISSSRDTGNGS